MTAEIHATGTRERLIAAARTVICDVGFERTRMEDVAAAAGVSRAAVYYHFNSKADLGRALADDVFERLTEIVRATLADGPVEAVIDVTVRFLADRAPVGRVLIGQVPLSSNPVAFVAHHVGALIAVLRRRLAADIAAGRVRAMDPDIAAGAVAGIMRVAALELLWNESTDVEHLTAELTDFVRHALAPPP